MTLNAPPFLNADLKKGERREYLVFIHGNSSSMKQFDKLFEIYESSFNLIRIDLPGHGNSFHSGNEEDYSFKNYIKQVSSFINALNEDVLLFGNSMGGHLAIELTPKLNKLKGLIIQGTPPLDKPANFEAAFNPFPEIQNMFLEEVTKETALDMFVKATHNHDEIELLTNDFFNCDPKVRKAIKQDIFDDNLHDEVKIFQKLKVKKYIIHGLQDPGPNFDYIKSVSIDAKIMKIDQCGHYPALEQPIKFINAIDAITKEVFD